jgi:hypothetical protein
MTKKADWDYALRLRGLDPSSIPMAKLAEYLKDWAGLLGDANAPIFRGVVRGSVVLRARVDPIKRTEVRARLRSAQIQVDPGAAKFIEKLKTMMDRDAVVGTVIDRSGEVVMEFKGRKGEEEAPREYIVPDSGTIDGVVVGIQGIDDTVHIRLQEAGGAVFSVALRDLAMARKFAAHFRSDPIRVQVHGTWKRTAAGIWEPHNLMADGFDELDQTNAKETMDQLRAIPRNGWAELPDPIGFWKDLRGIE